MMATFLYGWTSPRILRVQHLTKSSLHTGPVNKLHYIQQLYNYFPKSHNKSHKSVVGISDLNIHNAGVVVSMVSNLIPIIKSEYPELQYVHYLTDSPTSQYRNKSIFEFLTRHKTLFRVNARWDFLESGHGKGPCDGLGAASNGLQTWL